MNQTKTPQEKLLLGIGIGIAAALLVVAIVAAVIIYNVATPLLDTPSHEEPEVTLPPLPENLYDPEDFAMDGDYLGMISGEYMLGIDVSEWNREIDWKAVKDAGIEFAYIRIGGRGWGEAGNMYGDAMAQANYQGAKEQGLLVGVYFFSQAITAEEAREEALYCLEYTKDWELDLPIAMDWEYISDEARTGQISRRDLTDCVLEFNRTIVQGGRKMCLYTGAFILHQWMYPHELQEIPFWLAMYTTEMDYPYEFAMWQYTGKGRVPGISTDVDMNIMPIK